MDLFFAQLLHDVVWSGDLRSYWHGVSRYTLWATRIMVVAIAILEVRSQGVCRIQECASSPNRLGVIGALVCLTAIVGLIAINSGSGIVSLDGFMPTSGGKGGNDQAARQGVGDGDMMVAAKDQAFTFGPIESEVFLESQLPLSTILRRSNTVKRKS